MISCDHRKGGTRNVADQRDERRETPEAGAKPINLRELGFEFRLSREAERQISRVEARAARVYATAARFAFR